MTDDSAPQPRRWGWLVATGIAGVIAASTALGALWALSATVDAGAGGWGVVTGGGAGVLFWTWISAGCWRRAHEPEPALDAPAPVPRSPAFVAANVALAIVFTGMVAGGLWATVEAARTAERIDLVEHRVMVAARAVDLTVADLRLVADERRPWVATGAGTDPAAELLPVEGADVIDVAFEEDTAAVLFRPADGPPCVVLDIDSNGLLSTRSTNNC